MSHHEQNYESLHSEYLDPFSLMYKKLRIVDKYIHRGECLLDIGIGTGELIELEKQKFSKIYGIDISEISVNICLNRFQNNKSIHIMQSNINNLKNLFANESFDYITCCDVLEHIGLEEFTTALDNVYALLKNGGRFIFTGPGMFERIKIVLNISPMHTHSHSSYGWADYIKRAGFKIVAIETVEFPLIHSDFLREKLHIFGKCCSIVGEKSKVVK